MHPKWVSKASGGLYGTHFGTHAESHQSSYYQVSSATKHQLSLESTMLSLI